jgi:hypothetical protein
MNFPGGPMDIRPPQPVIHFPNLPPPLNMLMPEQFMQMYPFPFPTQNTAPPSTAAPPVIQPDLDTAASHPPTSDAGTMQDSNVSRSRRRNGSTSGSEADDERLGSEAAENSAKRRKPSSKRKKKSAGGKILSVPVKDLSTWQRKTRKELQVSLSFDLVKN